MKNKFFLGITIAVMVLGLAFTGCETESSDSSDWWDAQYGVGPNVLKEAGTVYNASNPSAATEKWDFEGSSYKAWDYGYASDEATTKTWYVSHSGTYTYNTPNQEIYYNIKKEKAPTTSDLEGQAGLQVVLTNAGVDSGVIDKLAKNYTAKPDADGLIPANKDKPLYEFYRTHYDAYDKVENMGVSSGKTETAFLLENGYAGKTFSNYINDKYLKTDPHTKSFDISVTGIPYFD